MTSEGELWESKVLRDLQQVSEARGLKLYVNPPPDVVPDFLGDFRPDAIARGPEGGIVIELKRQRTPASDRPLAEIARRVSAQKGWEFRAIYVAAPVADERPITKPTKHQLQAVFDQIEALINGGHHAAALLVAWATLESLARLVVANSKAGTSRAFAPLQAIQTLAEEGYLENEAADKLRGMVKLRNAVAHGDLSADVQGQEVGDLLQRLRAIAAEIEAAHIEAKSETASSNS
jgi:uncharacterized protein YutE (UPF0331/DUF86 family)